MKTFYPLALLVATGTLLVVTNSSLRASETDDRIESSASKSYVFKTYLKDDAIKTQSKDGAVTLTGTVAETSHRTLAENTLESLPGVKSLDNQLIVVETRDGVVTVGGIAKNAAEKSLVTKLVNDINGVSRVINNMTIAAPVSAGHVPAPPSNLRIVANSN